MDTNKNFHSNNEPLEPHLHWSGLIYEQERDGNTDIANEKIDPKVVFKNLGNEKASEENNESYATLENFL